MKAKLDECKRKLMAFARAAGRPSSYADDSGRLSRVAQQLGIGSEHRILIIRGDGSGAVRSSQLASERRSAQQRRKRVRQRRVVASRRETSIHGRQHRLHVADIGRRDWQPGGHRFQHRERHLLGVRRKGEYVEMAVGVLRLGHVAGELHRIGHIERDALARTAPVAPVHRL